jgi:ketosteroid isomerase-like protein
VPRDHPSCVDHVRALVRGSTGSSPKSPLDPAPLKRVMPRRTIAEGDGRENLMGEARDVMDRVTDAAFSGDVEALRDCYADDATAVTPDAGELQGREAIIEWIGQFTEALPDARWESLYKHEMGDTAIDEGFVVGTNTGPLRLPTGETLPATGKRLRVRGTDAATVQNGRISSHRFYYDQMEFLTQLGLAPQG